MSLDSSCKQTIDWKQNLSYMVSESGDPLQEYSHSNDKDLILY